MYLVTVIITTYGNPIRLKKAIESVLNQTYSNIEIIVVDDNADESIYRPKTEEIMKHYVLLDNLIYIKHHINQNGAVARNTGLKLAKGYYIAFLDSDDEFYKDRIQILTKKIESYNDSKYGGVYSGCKFYRNDKLYSSNPLAKTGNFIVETLACKFQFHSGSNIFVKKEVIEELDGFDINFIRHQDYEFMTRYFTKYDLLGVNQVLLKKNNDNTNLPKTDTLLKVKKLFLNKFNYLIEGLCSKDKNYVMFSHYYDLSIFYLREKKRKKAKKMKSQALNYSRLNIKQFAKYELLLIKSIF